MKPISASWSRFGPAGRTAGAGPAPAAGAAPAPVTSGPADASPLDRTLESPDATEAALAAGLAFQFTNASVRALTLAIDPMQAQFLRYFAGLNDAEIAVALDVGERTVRRDWEHARLLLAKALK